MMYFSIQNIWKPESDIMLKKLVFSGIIKMFGLRKKRVSDIFNLSWLFTVVTQPYNWGQLKENYR